MYMYVLVVIDTLSGAGEREGFLFIIVYMYAYLREQSRQCTQIDFVVGYVNISERDITQKYLHIKCVDVYIDPMYTSTVVTGFLKYTQGSLKHANTCKALKSHYIN